MPKIKITDIDKTGAVQSTNISNVVYIPGKSVYTGSGEAVVAVEPLLFTSLAELKAKNYGSGDTAIYYDDSVLSYRLAEKLLELGMEVLYEGVLESGNAPVIDWTRLQDKGLYDIRFLTLGGYFLTQQGMITCAQTRGDCVALLTHPTTIDSAYVSYNLIEKQPADWSSAWESKYKGKIYKKGASGEYVVVTDSDAPDFATNTYYTSDSSQAGRVRAYFETFKSGDTSYAAAFTPNFKTANETLVGNSSLPVDIPATFGYLFAYAKDVQNNPEWYAIAGSSRGIINELYSVDYNYTNAEIEMLQGRAKSSEVSLDDDLDNVGCAINPIAYVRPFGYVLWGNRTFKENDAVKKTTASSFLNVRNLVSAIKKALYNAARKYSFEQNSDLLWVNFQSQITPLLDKMRSGNGILGYKFVKLATTAKARLKARLIIIPIEAVEDFEIELELNDSISTTEE